MSDVLLNYAFDINVIVPTASADISYIRNVLVVVKPKQGVPVGITKCTTEGAIAALTANEDAFDLLSGGLTQVYILPCATLETSGIDTAINDNLEKFFTILISSDFSQAEIGSTGAVKAYRKFQDILYTAVTGGTAGNSISVVYTDTEEAGGATVTLDGTAITVEIESGVTTAATIAAAFGTSEDAEDLAALVSLTVDSGDETDPQTDFTVLPLQHGAAGTAIVPDFGNFEGVIAHSFDVQQDAEAFGDVTDQIAFYGPESSGGNLAYALGKLLSAVGWKSQQYIEMPYDDEISVLGDAESLFNDRVGFVITSPQFGQRLALFTCDSRAVVAPYVIEELKTLIQSRAVQYFSINQPNYTPKEATLMESDLQQIITQYVTEGAIEYGTITVEVYKGSDFIAKGDITISSPKAFWRVQANLTSEA